MISNVCSSSIKANIKWNRKFIFFEIWELVRFETELWEMGSKRSELSSEHFFFLKKKHTQINLKKDYFLVLFSSLVETIVWSGTYW